MGEKRVVLFVSDVRDTDDLAFVGGSAYFW
jgi:hypothetical protein